MVTIPSDASPRPAPIIAMAGFQSGAGKTKAALHLAGGLASHGARVLLIDTDIQNSVALTLGVSDPELSALDAQGKTFGSALSKGFPLASCASEDNPAVIYAGHEIGAVEFLATANVVRDPHPDLAFESWAADLGVQRAAYDYILIDCAPGLSFVTTAVLWAADVIVVPAVLDSEGQKAVTRFLEHVREVMNAGGRAVARRVWVLPRRVSIDGDDRFVLETKGTAPDLVEQLAPILSEEFGTIELDGKVAEATGESSTTPATALGRLRRISGDSPYAALVQHTLAWRDRTLPPPGRPIP